MDSSSDEEEGCTFVHVLSQKYHPDNFPYGQGVVVLSSPPGSPVKGEVPPFPVVHEGTALWTK